MPYTIPNEAAAAFVDQTEPHECDFANLVLALQSDGVIRDCAVTAQGTPDMTVAVAAGIVRIGEAFLAVTAGNVTITTANGSNPRYDLITIDNAGAKAAVAGTAAANPTKPDIPANKIVIAEVYVPAGDTAINSNQIIDKRCFVPARGVVDRVTSTTDIANDATEQTLYTKSILANLLGTNKLLRLTILGDYLNNSGSNKTVTLKVKFGATTLFDDVSGGLITGATRRPFLLQLWLNNTATNAQILTGTFWMGRPTAPTSGIGDLGAQMSTDSQSVIAPLGNNSAGEDTTAAKTLAVTMQHSAAAATISLRLLSAYLEIL